MSNMLRICNKAPHCTYCFTGLTLGFMPITGLVNEDHLDIKCTYVALFPSILILINSLLSIIPIILVAVLYTIILFKALKNAKQINKTLKTVRIKSSNDATEIRAYRGHGNYKATQSVKVPRKLSVTKIKRSASFDTADGCRKELKAQKDKSKSIENLSNDQIGNLNGMTYSKTSNKRVSDTSFLTISTSTIINDSIADIRQSPHKIAKAIANCTTRYKEKMKEPNRLRAVLIVMLTTGSFIMTWIPFFITAIFYVFCEEKLTNPKCLDMRILLRGPLAVIAFCNNILNPLIYAWWHKGFQQSVKTYFQKYIKSIFKNPYL